MRLGIFGGSFDPVHDGHLALAHACQRKTALDEVWFIPTAVQPLKQQGPHATDAQRIEMLRLAILSEPSWRSFDARNRPRWVELHDRHAATAQRGTARRRALLPDGGRRGCRSAAKLARAAGIFSLATPLVVRRAGQPEPDLAGLRALCAANKQPRLVEMPAVEASSTEIRRRASAGEPLDDLVPAGVAAYISTHNLYR